MKIKSIRLANFKRFKELTISGLPETAKLVLLVGENGCGKSSLFDALHSQFNGRHSAYKDYYTRSSLGESVGSVARNSTVNVSFHVEGYNPRKAVYVRSAHRNTPDFAHNSFSKVGSALQEHRFDRLIDNDQATGQNYLRLISGAFGDLFEGRDPSETIGAFRESILAEIRAALHALFPELTIDSLADPFKESTFKFTKGEVAGFKYENLSGGEKSAFDLILDLIVKRKEYDDTVFCIDEPEVHINNRVQAKLLKALYSLVPDNCQLWLATHSIGMMRAAYQLQQKKPEEVAFLDFSGRDFDKPQEITPSPMTRELWERMHEIVLGDLAALVMPEMICLCEGEADEGCYTEIFKHEEPLVKFLHVHGKGNLKNMRAMFARVAPEVISVRDRDSMTARESAQSRKDGVSVLSRDCLESYLLDDEVLQKFCQEHFSSDESMLNRMRNACKGGSDDKDRIDRILRLANDSGQNFGETRPAFMQEKLSPLITSDMEVYQVLKRDIFGGRDKKASR